MLLIGIGASGRHLIAFGDIMQTTISNSTKPIVSGRFYAQCDKIIVAMLEADSDGSMTIEEFLSELCTCHTIEYSLVSRLRSEVIARCMWNSVPIHRKTFPLHILCDAWTAMTMRS